ncbi:MAG TPA: SpoIIE family protein phosphatase [Thermoanaerobaculia bacterium]
MIRSSRVVNIHDQSAVAEARRTAIECAGTLQMSENAAATAGLVTTELATNLVKHTPGGSLIFGSDEETPQTLTITSIDKGSGIANVQAAMSDGFSTAGSPGTGLGAITRAVSSFDIYTMPDKGTAIVCRIGDRPRAPVTGSPSRITLAGLCVAKPGEDESGDAWASVSGRDAVTIGVVDGLGHGHAASIASAYGTRVVREQGGDQQLERIIETMHGALRPTRGAAVGLARIHPEAGRVDFVGVGNIAGTIATDDAARKTVSHNGIVGHEMRKVQSFSYPWTADSLLVLNSDGIGSAWSFKHYPGLVQHDPAVIAAVIFRDFCRGSDDATVVVAKAS